MTHFAHRLDCTHPNVHTHRGITKTYTHCRTCGAEQWTDHARRTP